MTGMWARPSSATTAGAAPSRDANHAPALDGLRGLAVAAVVIYHSGPAWFSGGFLGVDVFFVLSGFLITAILLRSDTTAGLRSYLSSFWSRRARRLLPAMGVTFALVTAWAAWLAPDDLARRARGDTLAAMAQVANWRFVFEGRSYFAEFIPSPVRHLWSLGVEMQWYLLWPLVVFAVAALVGQRRVHGVLAVVAAALAAASTLLAAVLFDAGADPSRIYYGTDTHAAPLLVGAVLAALLGHPARSTAERAYGAPPAGAITQVVAAGALLALLAAFIGATGLSPWLYQGGFGAVALAAAALICCVLQPDPTWRTTPVTALLALRPLRYLGLISYGVYLYHWPLFFIITPERTGLDGPALFFARAAITLAMAAASYHLLEVPVRRQLRLSPRRGLALAATTSVVLIAVLLAATAARPPGWMERVDATSEVRPVPVTAAPAAEPPSPSDGTDPAGEPVQPERPVRVLVVGDSMAYSLALGFDELEPQRSDLLVWNQGILYCELMAHPRRESGSHEVPADPRCADWPDRWAGFVEEFDPDVSVLIVGPWEVFDRRVDSEWLEFGDPRLDALLRQEFVHAVDVLSAGGATVVLMAAPPFDRDDGVSASEWSLRERWRVEHLNDLLRSVADGDPARVGMVDLGALVCPAGVCANRIGDVALRSDGIHFTSDGARVVAAELVPLVRAEVERVQAAAAAASAAGAPEQAAPEPGD
ncbi:MAG: acyltransferase [Acidimicrobiia bacterium]|nr:acyltransferase [Acidimicrobiia bacterium]